MQMSEKEATEISRTHNENEGLKYLTLTRIIVGAMYKGRQGLPGELV